jgi:hypothetical protein
MPGLDSAETLAAMRQVRPKVKVMLMSGYDRREPLHRFREPTRRLLCRNPTRCIPCSMPSGVLCQVGETPVLAPVFAC